MSESKLMKPLSWKALIFFTVPSSTMLSDEQAARRVERVRAERQFRKLLFHFI